MFDILNFKFPVSQAYEVPRLSKATLWAKL